MDQVMVQLIYMVLAPVSAELAGATFALVLLIVVYRAIRDLL